MTPGETSAQAGIEELLADDDTVGGLVDSVPASSPEPRHQTQTVQGDLAGGFVAAVVSVAESIPYGLLVFAPLGAAASP